MKSESSNPEEATGWFDRKENVQKLLKGLFIGCAVLVLIDVGFLITGYDKHPYLKWEQWPGFYAVYGFVASVLLVLIARYALRPLVMKGEDYYESKEKAAEEKGGSNDV